MPQNSNQPGHFGADSPAYVFGRQNLDYNPVVANDSDDLKASVEDVKADFPQNDDDFDVETTIEIGDFASHLLYDKEVIEDYELIQHSDSLSAVVYLKDGQIAELSVAERDPLNNPYDDMIGVILYDSEEAREDYPESYTDLDFYHADEIADYLKENTKKN